MIRMMMIFVFCLFFIFVATAVFPVVDVNWWDKNVPRSAHVSKRTLLDMKDQKEEVRHHVEQNLAKLLFAEDFVNIVRNDSDQSHLRAKFRKPPDYMRLLYDTLNKLTASEESVTNFTEFAVQQYPNVRIKGFWATKAIHTNFTITFRFDGIQADEQHDFPLQAELLIRTKNLAIDLTGRSGKPEKYQKRRYQILDVTSTLHQWRQGRKDPSSSTLFLRIGSVDWQNPRNLPTRRAFLVLYYGMDHSQLTNSTTLDKHPKRKRRQTEPSTVTTATTTTNADDKCALHEWYVDFEELGWSSWVLAPTGFQANMCFGNCPAILMQEEYHASNHAMLRGLYRASQPEDKITRVSPACCVPTSLRAANVMYTEGRGIVIRKLNNIIAEGCGCQ